MSDTIPQVFESVRRAHPARPMIISTDGTLTYDDMGRRVDAAANLLHARGVAPGERVGIWLPNIPEWLVFNLAALTIGATCVPLNARLRETELLEQLEVTRPTAIVTMSRFMTNDYVSTLERVMAVDAGARSPDADRAPFVTTLLTVDGATPWAVDARFADTGDELLPALQTRRDRAQATEIANIFWTSGSTGPPKGAITTHEVLANIRSFVEYFGLDAHDRIVASSPFYYVAGYYWGALAAVVAGAAVLPVRSLTPDETLEVIESHDATALFTLAHTHRALLTALQDHPRKVGSIRSLYSGGGALSVDDIQRLHDVYSPATFAHIYGLTESGGIATMTRKDDSMPLLSESIGFLMPSLESRIVDPEGEGELPADSVGELQLRGQFVTQTYLTGTGDRPAVDADGWLSTGDLARIDVDGRHRFMGRIKDVIKVGGENVSAHEVEAVLARFPGVTQAIAVGIADEARGEVVGVAVVLEGTATPQFVLELCREQMSAYKRPRHLLSLDAIPLTWSNKPDRRAVRELIMADVAATAAESSR